MERMEEGSEGEKERGMSACTSDGVDIRMKSIANGNISIVKFNLTVNP